MSQALTSNKLATVFIVNLVFATLTASPTTAVEERISTYWNPGKLYLELILAVKNPDPCVNENHGEDDACKAACPDGGSCKASARFFRRNEISTCKCTGSKTLKQAWAKWLNKVTNIPSTDTPCVTAEPCTKTCSCLIEAGGAADCVKVNEKKHRYCYCVSAEARKKSLEYLLWLPQQVAIRYWNAIPKINGDGKECENTDGHQRV